MRGRKPKPTHLKLVTASLRARSLNPAEPKPQGELFAPPSWLSDEQRATWRYAIAHAPAGLLKKLDAGLLTLWVCAAVEHRTAAEEQMKLDQVRGAKPLLVRSHRGPLRPSPYLRIGARAAQAMARIASELGFTPASRCRLAVPPRGGDDGGAGDYGL
jgi:P27 family predicted phage terminase small subunit